MSNVEAWQLRLLSSAQLVRTILDTPSVESPAVRLALRGEAIMRKAEDEAARGQLEIANAFRGG